MIEPGARVCGEDDQIRHLFFGKPNDLSKRAATPYDRARRQELLRIGVHQALELLHGLFFHGLVVILDVEALHYGADVGVRIIEHVSQ